jgi:large subunit ribosomal protein L24
MIRKGDNVIVISGSEKGKKGQIAHKIGDRIIIEGLNLLKRHQKARKSGQKGQIIDKPMPIHISNVALVEGGKAVRTGRKKLGEKWMRVSRKTGKEI